MKARIVLLVSNDFIAIISSKLRRLASRIIIQRVHLQAKHVSCLLFHQGICVFLVRSRFKVEILSLIVHGNHG
jgi:hypothetical protein